MAKISKLLGLVTAQGLAEATGFGSKSIQAMRKQGLLPSVRIGKRFYYDANLIRTRWLQAGGAQPKESEQV